MILEGISTSDVVFSSSYRGGLEDPCEDFEVNIQYSNLEVLNSLTVAEYNTLNGEISEILK